MPGQFQPKEGTIYIFKNEIKTKESQPDLRVKACVNGAQVEFAVWKTTSETTGKSYYKGKISEPYTPKARPKQDDDVPF